MDTGGETYAKGNIKCWLKISRQESQIAYIQVS